MLKPIDHRAIAKSAKVIWSHEPLVFVRRALHPLERIVLDEHTESQ